MSEKKSKILITKDACLPSYLGCYGGTIFNTPNIDKLAKEGTLFTNCYTAAPSSGMAYSAMFSGLYPFEMDRSAFAVVDQFKETETLFQILEQKGYSTHVIWHKKWFKSSRKKAMVFTEQTHFHNLDIAQNVGPHKMVGGDTRVVPKLDADPKSIILNELEEILSNKSEPVFIWFHAPHVYAGRTGYGSDIDIHDDLVGGIADIFDGDIYISSDHGHMNSSKGIPCYGHHIYENAVKIPLIVPRMSLGSEINYPVSNTQLKDLISLGKIEKQEYVSVDTRYYAQPNRKLAIIKDNYKYIYNKKGSYEELYDLIFDPYEQINLLVDKLRDVDRKCDYYLDEVVHYPNWDQAQRAYEILKKERKRIWKKGGFFFEQVVRFREVKRVGFLKIIIDKFRGIYMKGRWNSKVLSTQDKT